jgi:MFS family permease
LLIAVARLIDDRPAAGGSWRSGFRAVPALMREALQLSRENGRLLLLMLASFVGGFAILSLEAFWQPFFAALPGAGANSLLLGGLIAGSFLVGMAGNLLSIPLSRRLGGRHGLVGAVSRLLQGTSMLGLAAAGVLVPAAGLFWLTYLMGGVGLSPHQTLLNAEIPAQRRSTMLSVQSLAAYVGSFLGGAALGYVAEHASIRLAWTIAGALVVLSLLPYLLLDRGRDAAARRYESAATQTTHAHS